MQTPRDTQNEGCQGGCPSCPMNAASPSDEGLPGWVAAHDVAARDSLGGSALVLRSLTAFLLPVLCAAVGAVVASDGRSEVKSFLGLIIGLACGIVIAKIIFFFLPSAKQNPDAASKDAAEREDADASGRL